MLLSCSAYSAIYPSNPDISEIPHYFLESKVDMQSALDWLTERNRQVKPKERLLPIVLFIKAVALALKQVPALNAEWKDGLIYNPITLIFKDPQKNLEFRIVKYDNMLFPLVLNSIVDGGFAFYMIYLD